MQAYGVVMLWVRCCPSTAVTCSRPRLADSSCNVFIDAGGDAVADHRRRTLVLPIRRMCLQARVTASPAPTCARASIRASADTQYVNGTNYGHWHALSTRAMHAGDTFKESTFEMDMKIFLWISVGPVASVSVSLHKHSARY